VRTARRHTIAAALAGLVLLSLATAAPNVQFLDERNVGDTHLYSLYGENVRDGSVPYDDFYMEYPPGAIPVFVAPTVGAEEQYASNSKWIQWLLAAGCVVLVALAVSSAGRTASGVYLATAAVAVAPVALGRVTFTRFDFWPAALTGLALALLARRRHRLGGGALAVATAAKIYPVVLLPLAIAFAWREGGRRKARDVLMVYALVLVGIVLPFAALGAGGIAHSLLEQLRRPLQIESLGSSILLAAGQLDLYEPTVVTSHGSQNLAGNLPAALALLAALGGLLLLGATWLAFARGPGAPADLLAAAATAVVVFVVLGKVLSPQYLIWLIPLVPLVGGRRGCAAAGLLLLALAVTQVWAQGRFGEVVALEPVVWLVLLRNLVLVAVLVLLLQVLRRRREEDEEAAGRGALVAARAEQRS